MIVIDTSVIYALLDGADRRHQECVDWYERETGALATTPLVLAEVDHLVSARLSAAASSAWRADLAGGAYDVHWWSRAEIDCAEVAGSYGDLGLGLTDASLVALAARLETARVATLDERHFRAVSPRHGAGSFTLLPSDI